MHFFDRMIKAKSKPGYLALFGRDGYFSYQSMDIENRKPSSSVHLFHYDSGGAARADLAADGVIVTANVKGALQVFQPKDPVSSRRPSVVCQDRFVLELATSDSILLQVFPRSQSPLVPPVIFPSQQGPSQLDPFIAKIFERPEQVPDSIAQEMSWDEKQEEARVAQERKM